MHMHFLKRSLLCLCLNALLWSACSSPLPVKQQAYASLRQERTFEFDFEAVWKGIERVLKNHPSLERDPETVDPLEWKSIPRRFVSTDWVYSQSRDKFVEYKVNGFPKKQYLQTRLRYRFEVSRVLGGTHVQVVTIEEIENLNPDGSTAGYQTVESIDSSRASEWLSKIETALLAPENGS